jgi:hypothetical protein
VSGLRPSERAPGPLVADDVTIAEDAEIGGNVVLHAGTIHRANANLGHNRSPITAGRSSFW